MFRRAGWAALMGALVGGSAFAQQSDFGLIDGTIVFLDEQSNSRCAAINTFNADFMIRSCDRRIVLLSGEDRLTPYEVDTGYNVFGPDEAPAGRIRFATDNDGLRQVFWLSDDGFTAGPNLVLNYIVESDSLTVATVAGQDGEQIPLSPINISNTQCDPLNSFDGEPEVLCERVCGMGALIPSLMLTLMLAWRPSGGRRRRRRPTSTH